MKGNMNKTNVMISKESGYRWPCGVVEVLVESQFSVLTVRSWFTGSVVV